MSRRFTPQISDEFLEVRPSAFKPWVLIETSDKMPSSIAMCAAAGNGMKYISLPADFSEDDLPKVREIVRKHYEKNQGHCVLYGRITGYFFAFSPTECFRLTTSGDVIERKHARCWPQSNRVA